MSKWITSAVSLLGMCVLSALCIVPSMPTYFADQQGSKQAVCRRNLQLVMKRFAELRDGGLTLEALAAVVPAERRLPYTYVLGEGVTVLPAKAPAPTELQRQLAIVKDVADPGLRGTCPDCEYTVACVGNTDDDDFVDLISISSERRWVYGNNNIEPGEVYRHASDFPDNAPVAVRFEPSDAGR